MCTAWPCIFVWYLSVFCTHRLQVICGSQKFYLGLCNFFLQIEDPLAEATKYLKLLQNNSSDSLETHILSFELSMRKQKVLLAFQVCYFCLISLIQPQDTLGAPIMIFPLCLHPDRLWHTYLCKFIDANHTAAICSYIFFFLIINIMIIS